MDKRKVALVTGSSRGIGRAIAAQLAREHAAGEHAHLGERVRHALRLQKYAAVREKQRDRSGTHSHSFFEKTIERRVRRRIDRLSFAGRDAPAARLRFFNCGGHGGIVAQKQRSKLALAR